jgi:hypothetical protein
MDGVRALVLVLVLIALLGLKLTWSSRIPLLLLLLLLLLVGGGMGRTMLRGEGRLVVVGLVVVVVFGLVLSSRLGHWHGRRRLLGGRSIVIWARHSGEVLERGRSSQTGGAGDGPDVAVVLWKR